MRPEAAPHTYDDKFAMAEAATVLALESALIFGELLGVDGGAASKVAAQDAKLQRNKEVRKVESNIKERKRDSYKRKLGAGKQPKMAGQMKDLLSKLQSK